MLRRYPHTLRWRQALPPLFVLSLLGNALLGLFWPLFAALLALELAVYAGVLLAAGAHAALKQRDAALLWAMPLAMAVMHLAWGSGFLWSVLQGKRA